MFSPTAPYVYGPRLHEFIREMRAKALDGFDVMTVGEAPGSTVENALTLVGEERRELDMLFQFELMGVDHTDGDKWRQRPIDLVEMKEIIERWQLGLQGKAWNSNYLMNHDQPRSVSRFGDDGRWRVESAKALLCLNLSLGGTPYVYQGEEIGMTNAPWRSISEFRDLDSINYYNEALASGADPEAVMDSLRYMSRDNARTPMQWDSSAKAGFTAGEPWIGVNPNAAAVNVAAAEADPESVLQFLRLMIRFRKEHLALVYGSFKLLAREDKRLFAFAREGEGERLLVEINLSGVETGGVSSLPEARRLLSNRGAPDAAAPGALAPWEARISAL